MALWIDKNWRAFIKGHFSHSFCDKGFFAFLFKEKEDPDLIFRRDPYFMRSTCMYLNRWTLWLLPVEWHSFNNYNAYDPSVLEPNDQWQQPKNKRQVTKPRSHSNQEKPNPPRELPPIQKPHCPPSLGALWPISIKEQIRIAFEPRSKWRAHIWSRALCGWTSDSHLKRCFHSYPPSKESRTWPEPLPSTGGKDFSDSLEDESSQESTPNVPWKKLDKIQILKGKKL